MPFIYLGDSGFGKSSGPDILLQNCWFPHALLSSRSPESQLYSPYPSQACLLAENQPRGERRQTQSPIHSRPLHPKTLREAHRAIDPVSPCHAGYPAVFSPNTLLTKPLLSLDKCQLLHPDSPRATWPSRPPGEAMAALSCIWPWLRPGPHCQRLRSLWRVT